MSAVGAFKHTETEVGPIAITAAYGTALPMTADPRTQIQSSIFVYLDTVAGGGAKTVIRITADAAGDDCLIPDTEADLSFGITTANSATSVYKSDIIVPNGAGTYYVWVKLDVGTCNLTKVTITGKE
jgi:hypothetical protein